MILSLDVPMTIASGDNSIGQVVTDILSVITSIITFIINNPFLIFLALTPFIIGILVLLIRSFRG